MMMLGVPAFIQSYCPKIFPSGGAITLHYKEGKSEEKGLLPGGRIKPRRGDISVAHDFSHGERATDVRRDTEGRHKLSEGCAYIAA
jgi:hypothetical protein